MEANTRKAVLDLTRLADRAMQRFAAGKDDGQVDKIHQNHLKAYIAQIESALSALQQVDRDGAMSDELDVIDSQLSLLRSIHERNDINSLGRQAKTKTTWAQVVFDSDDSDDSQPLLSPRVNSPPAHESRFAASLRQRPAAKTKQPQPHHHLEEPATKDKTIFREEHDQLSAALLSHSAALKANSERMAGLLKEDRQAVDQVERLMDTTEGAFSGHTKRLGEQAKAESWGILTTLMVLVVGFVIFLFMFIFIRLT